MTGPKNLRPAKAAFELKVRDAIIDGEATVLGMRFEQRPRCWHHLLAPPAGEDVMPTLQSSWTASLLGRQHIPEVSSGEPLAAHCRAIRNVVAKPRNRPLPADGQFLGRDVGEAEPPHELQVAGEGLYPLRAAATAQCSAALVSSCTHMTRPIVGSRW